MDVKRNEISGTTRSLLMMRYAVMQQSLFESAYMRLFRQKTRMAGFYIHNSKMVWDS